MFLRIDHATFCYAKTLKFTHPSQLYAMPVPVIPQSCLLIDFPPARVFFNLPGALDGDAGHVYMQGTHQLLFRFKGYWPSRPDTFAEDFGKGWSNVTVRGLGFELTRNTLPWTCTWTVVNYGCSFNETLTYSFIVSNPFQSFGYCVTRCFRSGVSNLRPAGRIRPAAPIANCSKCMARLVALHFMNLQLLALNTYRGIIRKPHCAVNVL